MSSILMPVHFDAVLESLTPGPKRLLIVALYINSVTLFSSCCGLQAIKEIVRTAGGIVATEEDDDDMDEYIDAEMDS